MNDHNLYFKQEKVIQKDKVSKIGEFGTLCSPEFPDYGTTMPENQGITHYFLSK